MEAGWKLLDCSEQKWCCTTGNIPCSLGASFKVQPTFREGAAGLEAGVTGNCAQGPLLPPWKGGVSFKRGLKYISLYLSVNFPGGFNMQT